MDKILYQANSRGFANHGWLKSAHSFSFADYYNPERMGFGLLRVLNDDFVAPGMGFDTHPHKDMEIISIPLKGSLHHKDSQGHEQIIKHGEVQLMSAGTGVLHSEYNASTTEEVNFLQIWIIPEKKGTPPRYDQQKFHKIERSGKFQTIVSPLSSNEEGIKINQQTYFSLIDLKECEKVTYEKKKINNGIYLFLIEGQVEIDSTLLDQRDALGLMNTDILNIESKSDSNLLMIEVPLK